MTNITAVAGARPEEQGLASGLFVASFQVGSGVILGVVASVLTTGVRSGMSAYRLATIATAGVSALAVVLCVTGFLTRMRAAAKPEPAGQTRREQEPADETSWFLLGLRGVSAEAEY